MAEYVCSLILVGVVAALMEMLTLSGDSGQSKLKLITGICLLLACLQPISQGVSYLKDLASGQVSPPWQEGQVAEDYQQMLDSFLCDTSRDEVEKFTYDTLESYFGIGRDTCRVVVETESIEGIPHLPGVYITLTGAAVIKNPHQIEAYFEKQLSCECHVSVDM